MKRCFKCKQTKSLTQFYQDMSTKDKHNCYCKSCRNVYGKERYLKLKKKFTGLHGKWVDMKQRCFYPKSISYKYYGGRGITVCKEWRDSFQAFYEWAKDKYKKGLQIDRRNNDGNYEPSNCRFITNTENMRNNSFTKLDIKKVKRIRELLKEGKLTQKEIGKMFNVCSAHISAIKAERRWANV